MTNQKAPREFWIEFCGDPSDDKECYKRYSSTEPFHPVGLDAEVFHLVEHSAFEKQSVALKIAVEALEKLEAGYSGMFGCPGKSAEQEAFEMSPEIIGQTLSKIKETLGAFE